MYPRLIWEESGRAISLCLPLSCSLSCSLSSPTISSLLSFLHSFTLFSPAAVFLPSLTFWHFLPQLLFACLSPLFSLCPLTFLLWVFPPPLFFLASVASSSVFSCPFHSHPFSPSFGPFSLILSPCTSPLPQLSCCCLFFLPQVSDAHAISLPLCFRRPHPAPHSRLLLMIKAKTSHQ